MVKKIILSLLLLITLSLTLTGTSYAADPIFTAPPIPCNFNEAESCPTSLKNDVYPNLTFRGRTESCASSSADFLTDPTTKHYWVEDQEIYAQGQADERARQFIYWVLNQNSIDNHPALTQIWGTSRNIAYFLIILVVAIIGIGFIVGQRANFQVHLKFWPSVAKIATALLYITLSAAIVILLIQLSEVMMKFFIERLGGRDLFTIYFTNTTGQPGSSEQNYTQFIGCRDLNVRAQESAKAELFLLKATNITYYVMGVMLILRKVLLWFMLIVSPFLAILLPFTFIRNIGWIWIGVFFQWLFYGPLLALFLGATATIWRLGIPYTFDFSRVNKLIGYVYPTGILITYGGPGQRELHHIGTLNSGNYVDTFAEYIITLIMLWAVIFFPWWLLRIFRDYCCDGINAMKNILLSMYDQTRGNPSPPPQGPAPVPSFLKSNINVSKQVEVPVRLKLETIEDIKKTRTEDISRSLNLNASRLTDIARFETEKDTHETVMKNLNYLSNPLKAETPSERQQYMNLKTELFNRAIRDDKVAKQILSATTTSAVEKVRQRQEILQSTAAIPTSQEVTVKVNLSQEKIGAVNGSFADVLSASTQILNTIAENTQITMQQVQQIVTALKHNAQTTPQSKVVSNIVKETGIQESIVVKVLKYIISMLEKDKSLAEKVAKKENVTSEEVGKVIKAQVPALTDAKIEEKITIPPTVSIEDYEQVKKMWMQQYEQGEVPVTENISSRDIWVDHDIVTITNTLNKLLSPDEETRQQGLDDISYILPIFLVNNLKGDELLVYLKAKLEAAKAVKEKLLGEKNAEKRAEDNKEEFVDVKEAKKAEAEKKMSMSEELETPKEAPNATPLNLDREEKK